jgi:hypothetical protein
MRLQAEIYGERDGSAGEHPTPMNEKDYGQLSMPCACRMKEKRKCFDVDRLGVGVEKSGQYRRANQRRSGFKCRAVLVGSKALIDFCWYLFNSLT